MKKVCCLLAFLFSGIAIADVECKGKIIKIHKWNTEDRISILMDSANSWIQMPTPADDSMALMAFAADMDIELRWVDPDVNSCTDGWPHHKPLKGWWWVLKS